MQNSNIAIFSNGLAAAENKCERARTQAHLADKNGGSFLTDRQSQEVAEAAKAFSSAPSPSAKAYPGMFRSTVKYLLRTEVHTFAFSVAANAILSFFPFVLLLMTLIRHVLHSALMYAVVLQLLRDYLPAGQDFVIRNLNALVEAHQRAQVLSLLILLITSTGIFMPLEVALNRIWGFPNNRSYLGNQLIALGLALAGGVLAMLSIALTAENVGLLESLLHGHAMFLIRLVAFLVMKVSAIVASIAIFFLIYWLLPNGKVPVRAVLPAAVITGLLSETLKYAYIVALPRLNFQEVYGPFALSVSLMFWAFLLGLLLLTGANLSALQHQRRLAGFSPSRRRS
ncbi:MAG TPA: YihY/virulence factor BrkB family protein [Terriglobales bacterium]|nr:YihY/virulence factor BrkB family protein [Terriglobales bacterium]